MNALIAHWPDLAAILWCLLWWMGYTRFADRRTGVQPNLNTAMFEFRKQWMARMMERDMRMPDTSILSMTMRNISFFASTSIIIVGGMLAALGAIDEAKGVAEDLVFVRSVGPAVWEIRLLALAMVFTYAFFKFAWSLRQFNYTAVLVGAAPRAGEGSVGDPSIPKRAAIVGSLAVRSYNRGTRAYYFGLALLAGFIHPILLVICTLWVVWIVYRREFRSATLKALTAPAEELDSIK